MRIERFISGVDTLDGGTIHCTLLLEGGSTLEIGKDGRTFPQHKTHGLVFFGSSPDSRDVCFLGKGSQEENDLISAISDFLDRNCSQLWREALIDGEHRSKFAKGNNSVEWALHFLSAILQSR